MKTRKLVYTAIFISLGIILPITFHYLGAGLGPILLPMHIPVLLGGAFLGPFAGAVIGVASPFLSSLFTGMPPLIPIMPIMLAELAVYGWVIGYLFNSLDLNIYLSLIISMILGRISAGIMVFILVHLFSIGNLPGNPLLYIWGTVVTGLPGIIIQLIFIPLVINYLKNYIRIQGVNQSV